MALIVCPECKSRISDKAENCPHCGLPAKYFLSEPSDDTRTDVTMDSNITDYRYTADYFNGHHMVEKKTRRRKT